jgi:xanthine/uracil/vitamin C permease (AzgA family)
VLDIVTVLVMICGVVMTFSIDKALLLGFLIFIGGLMVTKRFRRIDKYMVISTVLLLIGVLLSL